MVSCKFTGRGKNKIPVCMAKGVKMSKYTYDKGGRFCSSCNRAFMDGSMTCPCCNSNTRGRPHNRHAREAFRERSGDPILRI